jgi:hypothetical protein
VHRIKHILQLLSIIIQTVVEASHSDDFEQVDSALHEGRLQKFLLGYLNAVVDDD